MKNKYLKLQPNQHTPSAIILIDLIKSHGFTAKIVNNNLNVNDGYGEEIIPISTRAVKLWLGYAINKRTMLLLKSKYLVPMRD